MLYLEQGELPVDVQKARKIVLTSEFYTLLYYLYEPTHPRIKILKPVVHQLCIPQATRQDVVDGYHAENAHIGFERLYDTVRQKYYWPRLYTDLYEVVQDAETVNSRRSVQKSKEHHSVHCQLHQFSKGYTSIYLIFRKNLQRDSNTSWSSSKVSADSQKFLRWKRKNQRRLPSTFILYFADGEHRWAFSVIQGKTETSQVIKNLCSVFKIKHLETSSYHPQSNAQCEVFNKTILQSFRLYCQQQKNWPKYINPLLYSYRATNAVKTTKISPFEILHGFPMRLSVDNVFLDNHSQGEDTDSYMETLAKRIQLTQRKLLKKTSKTAKKSIADTTTTQRLRFQHTK